jgi:hypothetical protein
LFFIVRPAKSCRAFSPLWFIAKLLEFSQFNPIQILLTSQHFHQHFYLIISKTIPIQTKSLLRLKIATVAEKPAKHFRPVALILRECISRFYYSLNEICTLQKIIPKTNSHIKNLLTQISDVIRRSKNALADLQRPFYVLICGFDVSERLRRIQQLF